MIWVIVKILKWLVHDLGGGKPLGELLGGLEQLKFFLLVLRNLMMLLFSLDGYWDFLVVQLLRALIPRLKILVLIDVAVGKNLVLIETLIRLLKDLFWLQLIVGGLNAHLLV